MPAYDDVIHLEVRVNDALTVAEDYYFGAGLGPTGSVWRVQDAAFLPMTSVTKDASDFRSLTLSDGSTTFGVITTEDIAAGVSLTAGTRSPMTLSGACEVTVGTSVLKLASDDTGSTGAVADGLFCVTLARMS